MVNRSDSSVLLEQGEDTVLHLLYWIGEMWFELEIFSLETIVSMFRKKTAKILTSPDNTKTKRKQKKKLY